VNAMIDVNTQL